MKCIFIVMGAMAAFLGVGFGAFGAHALKNTLTPEALAIYRTGVDYHMWHALGLFGIGCLQQQIPDAKALAWAGWLMFAGIVLFSGSLYVLAIYHLPWLGMITPLGGVCFMLAWLTVSISFYKRKTNRRYQ